jgi:hypothetical protein
LREGIRTGGDPWMRWRWTMHVHDACGRLALAAAIRRRASPRRRPELASARHFHAGKLELRAETLRARALLALERDDEAEQAIAAALAAADAIAYPAGRWRALRLQAEHARRRGRTADAEVGERKLRATVDRLAATLPTDELRRALYAAGRAPRSCRLTPVERPW